MGTYDQGPKWACEEAFNCKGVGAGVHDGWAINKNLYAPGAFLFGSSNYIDSIRMDNGDGWKSKFPTKVSKDVEGYPIDFDVFYTNESSPTNLVSIDSCIQDALPLLQEARYSCILHYERR